MAFPTEQGEQQAAHAPDAATTTDSRKLSEHGASLLKLGRMKEAAEALHQAFAANPNDADIIRNFAEFHLLCGATAEAEKLFLRALKLDSKNTIIHLHLANIMRATRRPELAERAYHHVLRGEPANAKAWSELGLLYVMQLKEEKARHCFQKSVEHAPELESARIRLLDLLEKASRLEELSHATDSAVKQFPSSPAVALYAAKLLRRTGKAAEALALLESHAGKLDKEAPENSPFFFELGQLYDRMDKPADAFPCFIAANRGQAKTADPALNKGDILKAIDRIRSEFTSGMAEGQVPKNNRLTPVFLVGFPRSGTTLLDHILSSHPLITVAEERPGIHRMTRKLAEIRNSAAVSNSFLNDPGYPANLARLTAEEIQSLRDAYHEAHGLAQTTSRESGLFIDKLPLNMLHVGLIRRVFPDARFILALRHPCDSVLSCFMQQFALNSAMLNFCDLTDAAIFYDRAFGLWEHYTKMLPVEFHTVHYEEVVSAFQPTVNALLKYLDVEWNEAVLQFDQTAREKGLTNTPSYHQVTEKIYTRASGRWLRYQEQMAPVLDILEPHAVRYGYSMES